MKKTLLYLFLAACTITACKEKENGPDVPPVVQEPDTELKWAPEQADADVALTITFTAGKSSQLYNYSGDVYAHLGIIDDAGSWKFVPADWNENLPKCKFTSTDKNTWSLNLEPSIREFFQSGTMSITRLGIVIRSSDGNKKGIQEDSFIPVKDNTYKGFEPEGPESKTLPAGMKYGINVVDDNTITFVLHDCDTENHHRDYAYIIGDFNDWTLSNTDESRMYRDDASECWWITVSGLEAGKEYKYQYHVGDFEGQPTRMADAFSEKVLDPDNDKYISTSTYDEDMTYPEKAAGFVSVVKTTRDNYNWEVPDFKASDDLVIYELHLRDFTASKNLKGALEKLDYLQELGVTAVELMPIQEFDGNNSWGYNPCFYFALDKAYGTPAMYKQFVDECHKRGLAVIVDVVYNHNTGNSPLAKLYWDASKNKTAANNPYFNVDAPHPFSVFHDFNHENKFVKDLVKRSTIYLMDEYHIDGFRFDLTKGFTQRKCTESNASDYDAGRIAILKEYNSAIKAAKSDAIVILEHFCTLKEEQELGQAGMKMWRNANNAFCQAAMGYQENSSFADLYTGTYNMPFNSWVGFMESHDEERVAYKVSMWGEDSLPLDNVRRMKRLGTSAAFNFLVPGPKMIWQFGELGYDISIEENGRTGEKPLHWDYLEVPERKALHDRYAQILKFRKDNPEFFTEDAKFEWQVSTSNWDGGRYIRCTAGDKSLVLIGNFDTSDHTIWFDVPCAGQWKDYFEDNAFVFDMKEDDLSLSSTFTKGTFKMFVNF